MFLDSIDHQALYKRLSVSEGLTTSLLTGLRTFYNLVSSGFIKFLKNLDFDEATGS